MTKQSIKQQVMEKLSFAAQEICKDYPEVPLQNLSIRLEYSRDEKFGDYSTPFALENKNLFQKPPLEVANELCESLKGNELFSEVHVTPPGFVNFRISPKHLLESTKKFADPHELFLRVADPKKILLEFVSANPTGPLNIVSARSAAYGDALARLLKTLGHSVTTEFYVNDFGNQVLLLGVAVLLRYRELLGYPLSFQEEEDGRTLEQLISTHTLPKESYRGEYLIPIAKTALESLEWKSKIDSLWNQGKFLEAAELLTGLAVQTNVAKQKKDLISFGVHFDSFFHESELHQAGKVQAVLDLLSPNDKKIEDGKTFFTSTNYGDDKDRVVVREDGRPTYLLADIAYHREKYSRGFQECIDIWGPDHYGYIARLTGAIQSLGYPKNSFRVLIAQQVNLIENKQKVKMSKRLGVFQTMEDLMGYLGESAQDVARYFFLMRSSDAPLDFDLDLAKDESDKNPVFYIQYAHARISSIFRELQVSPDISQAPPLEFLLEREDRLRLLFWICRFPEEVYDAALTREPHRLTNYLQSLSKSFTKFYGAKENRIKEKSGAERDSLLFLIGCTKIALSQGLGLLGIRSPEKMGKQVSESSETKG